MYDISVFIGRFQPFHRGHLHNIQTALANSKKIVINIGSSFNAPNIKNPFSFEQRKKMIEEDLELSGVDISRVNLEPLADYFYDEKKWENKLRENVYKHVKYGESIAVAGHIKDESSYYIESFPEWGFIPVDNFKNYNATDFREEFYRKNILNEYMCSNSLEIGTYKFLNDFVHTGIYKDLVEEKQYVDHYKSLWSKAPYKPIFVTTDAMVVCDSHILLVQRKNSPGKNLWALPGGFLENDETISKGILRELKEETQLELSNAYLDESKVKQLAFDYPSRSVRGRTITHAGLFHLKNLDSLPEIKAADDAKVAKWIPISSVIENMYDRMLEDHYQIITLLLDYL